MGDDDIKKLIFARRARFVAAAVASLNAAMCGGSTSQPEPCLSPLPPDDAGQVDTGNPQPCLSARPSDAGTDGDAAPQPCLTPQLDAGDGGDGGDDGG
ncbi:MAG: hypothetical protein JST00_22590 [Deltaproteobacteria bacterium]|nr:hypothetical protein [Deltaproteobacteria bacterium]